MAQETGFKTYNQFIKGFISEATPLTFPENATIDEENFVLHKSGERARRLGLDFESNYSLVDISSQINAGGYNDITAVMWEAVGNFERKNILVVQHGTSLSFFDAAASSVSAARLNQGNPLEIGGTGLIKIQATSMFGKLIIANGQKGFIVLSYDDTTDTVSREARAILVRDIWGVEDSFPTSVRPSIALQNLAKHEYNVVNQGWGQPNPDGGNAPYYHAMTGTYGIYPANSDIVTTGQDPTKAGVFGPLLVLRSFFGSTPAPKGFFILDAFRRGVSRQKVMDGWNLIPSHNNFSGDPFSLNLFLNQQPTWPSHFRFNTFVDVPLDESEGGITTVASYSGRVWFAGADFSTIDSDSRSPNLGTYVFFSQVVTGDDKIGKCYQENDPTADEISDIVDSDGGAVRIPDIGQILKLFTTGRSLLVFADNGIWEISGGEANFSATSFEIKKISNIRTVSHESIVEAEGQIIFWAEEGIYALSTDSVSLSSQLQNITEDTIQTWYQNLPSEAKQRAKGIYDPSDRKIRWLYGEKKNLGFKLTSKPYPYIYTEAIDSEEEDLEEGFFPVFLELIDSTFYSLNVTLKIVFQEYDNYPPEAIDTGFFEASGELISVFQEYDNYPPEAIDSGFDSVAGILEEVLITYSNYDPEAIDSSFYELTGTLV